MKMDSSLLLGTGGDNSVTGVGYFFEGAVTSGFPSDATENAVQANIAAAGLLLRRHQRRPAASRSSAASPAGA